MIIIDGKDIIMGRLASFAAKKLMLGEEVAVINSEKVVISGDKDKVLAQFQRKRSMGTQSTGPFLLRKPEMLLRRTIRGMLPYKQAKGRDAFARLKCYSGVPAKFEGKKTEDLSKSNFGKLPNLKYTTLFNVSKLIGGKI